MDVLDLFDCRWFGKPPRPAHLESDSLQPPEQPPMLRRGSAGSLSDGAATEQADGHPAARDPAARRRQPHAANKAVRSSYRHPNGLQQEEGVSGVLGTWAGRQRIFSDHLRQQQADKAGEQSGGRPAPVPEAGRTQRGGQPVAHMRGGVGDDSPPPVIAPPPLPAPAQQQAREASLDQELNAAWKWRFTRKWHAEQMKQFEGPAEAGPNGRLGEGEDEEEWAAALRLLGAVDGGLNMQIGRTLSLQNSSVVESSMDQSLTLLSPGLSQACMLLDGSVKESPLREEAAAATSQIVSVARKAQHLRQQQQEIERQVSERWEAASSSAQWVAQHLPAVQIDSWSAFAFVLVRLSEQRSQRQKLLVRGRNGATEQQAFATTEQEAVRAAVANRLPGARVELVASGRMEWVASPGQRRTLRIRASRLLPPAAKDLRLHNTASTSAVVAELTRASFPSGDFDIVAHAEAVGPAAAKAK